MSRYTIVRLTRAPGVSHLIPPWIATLPWAGYAADVPIASGYSATEAWLAAKQYVGGPIRLHRDGDHHDAARALDDAGIEVDR